MEFDRFAAEERVDDVLRVGLEPRGVVERPLEEVAERGPAVLQRNPPVAPFEGRDDLGPRSDRRLLRCGREDQ